MEAAMYFSSLPGLTRHSIKKTSTRHQMDARVEPAHDEGRWEKTWGRGGPADVAVNPPIATIRGEGEDASVSNGGARAADKKAEPPPAIVAKTAESAPPAGAPAAPLAKEAEPSAVA